MQFQSRNSKFEEFGGGVESDKQIPARGVRKSDLDFFPPKNFGNKNGCTLAKDFFENVKNLQKYQFSEIDLKNHTHFIRILCIFQSFC